MEISGVAFLDGVVGVEILEILGVVGVDGALSVLFCGILSRLITVATLSSKASLNGNLILRYSFAFDFIAVVLPERCSPKTKDKSMIFSYLEIFENPRVSISVSGL